MTRVLLLLFVCALVGLGFWARGRSHGFQNVIQRPGQPDIVAVDAENQEMNAAIAKARASLPAFRAALASPPPDSRAFAVKVSFAFDDGASHEHIWLIHPELTGNLVRGVVNNEPENVKYVRLGQTVTARAADISDWMYVERGVLKGGETIRVLYSRMSPEELKADLDRVGFKLE